MYIMQGSFDNKGFEITQERIDVINTATEYLHTLNDLKSMQ